MSFRKPSIARHLIWAGVPALGMIIFIAGMVAFTRYYGAAPSFPHAAVTIRHVQDGSPLSFDMELATTTEQRAYGLMFRRSLAAGNGMLFLWSSDQPATFWMKNTYISLDLLFVRHDGTIAKIVAHAKPFDLSYINSDEPVRAVIEIGGGEASRLDIQTGDNVLYSAFFDMDRH